MSVCWGIRSALTRVGCSNLEAEVERQSKERIHQAVQAVERTHTGRPLHDVKRELVRQLKQRDIALTWPDAAMKTVAQAISES